MTKWTQLKLVRRGVPLLLLALALGAGAFAFTASNTFGSSAGGAAGAGSDTISGYAISAPSYTLLSTNSNKIASFTFDITPATASTDIQAGVVANTFADSCSVGTPSGGSSTVTCTYTSGSEPLVSAADNLTVVGVN